MKIDNSAGDSWGVIDFDNLLKLAEFSVQNCSLHYKENFDGIVPTPARKLLIFLLKCLDKQIHIEIHIYWKVDREARMVPPIQTEYFLSGGAMLLIFMVEGERAVISF